MSAKARPLHRKVAGIVETVACSLGYTSVKAEECGGNQRIPLFVRARARKTCFCWVDVLVFKDQNVRVIVEIEETKLEPTHICGKLLASALSAHYIHGPKGNEPINVADSVLFIQVVNARNLRAPGTRKAQWELLGERIRCALAKIRPSWQYRLLASGSDSKTFATTLSSHVENWLRREQRP